PRGRGTIWFDSVFLNGAMNVDFSNQMTDRERALSAGATEQSDRYRLSVGRELAFDINSGLSYGFDSKIFSASMSRQIVSNLTVELAAKRPLEPQRTTASEEQTVRFLYDFRF